MIIRFKKSIVLLTAISFFCTNTVFAKSEWSDEFNNALVEQYVSDLNKGIKYKDLYGKLTIKNKKDLKFVSEFLKEHGDKTIPAPVVNGKVLTFNLDEKTSMTLEYIDFLNEKVKINDYEADFKKFKTLTEKIEYAGRILKMHPAAQSYSRSFKHNPILLLLSPKEAHALAPVVLIGLVVVLGGGNAIAWTRAYNLMKTPDNKPFNKLAELILQQSKSCIENDGAETISAKIESEFSCKTEQLNIKINEKLCFDSRDKLNKKSDLSKAIDKCCSENKERCESAFMTSFPPESRPASAIDRKPKDTGVIYRAN